LGYDGLGDGQSLNFSGFGTVFRQNVDSFFEKEVEEVGGNHGKLKTEIGKLKIKSILLSKP
jgi:hypothetical protein